MQFFSSKFSVVLLYWNFEQKNCWISPWSGISRVKASSDLNGISFSLSQHWDIGDKEKGRGGVGRWRSKYYCTELYSSFPIFSRRATRFHNLWLTGNEAECVLGILELFRVWVFFCLFALCTTYALASFFSRVILHRASRKRDDAKYFFLPRIGGASCKKSFQFQKTFFQGSSPTSDSSCLFARSFQGTAASVQKSEVTTINLTTFFSCNPSFFDDSGVANGRMMVAKGLTANKKGGRNDKSLGNCGILLAEMPKKSWVDSGEPFLLYSQGAKRGNNC